MTVQNKEWWKDIVVYQVYTRSFMDSNGDGVGDIPGVLAKLDHFSALGIDMIWLSPFCTSPNDDNGYDVSDYTGVQPEFGSMRDLEELITQAEQRGIGIMMDLVLNHSSDEHPWFLESRSSRDNPKRDWYHWKDPAEDGRVPNNWNSYFGGPTWTFDQKTGQYYLHTFASKQPDLNWENPKVREALYDIAIFWVKKGIKAFRLDAIHHIGKPDGLPDFADEKEVFKLFKNHPHTYRYLEEMSNKVFRPYNVFTVGETGGTTPESALKYIHQDQGPLDLIFHFNHCFLPSPRDPRKMRSVLSDWTSVLQGRAWDTIFFSNHDLPRQISTYGEEGPFRRFSAQAVAALLLTYWGTPFLYQGEEWGMLNAYFEELSSYRDKHAMGGYERRVKAGIFEPLAWAEFQVRNRDNSRVPLSWDSSKTRGFSKGSPWMPLHPRSDVSLENDLGSQHSIFTWYKKLIALRKSSPAIRRGTLRWLGPEDEKVLAYERYFEEESQSERLLIAINWTRSTADYELPHQELWEGTYDLLLGNYPAGDQGQEVLGLDFAQALAASTTPKSDPSESQTQGVEPRSLRITLQPYEVKVYRMR
jgi:glycosidase